ncbi:hypothetical protein [Cohaesibacter gelatinilyticus]|uniref:Uncharacterized protein n=1 Tax=Cohaesibacter gelatinilyticus TaxID=372072 RepID=A0A285PGU2_9HYPH|nr:hypothetical protein [Cohaesibacter gelatinilyticus]SNZ20950.1 hypothetical protein SAMN06265368_4064 [Cohaesibacter gelatinilyticus]
MLNEIEVIRRACDRIGIRAPENLSEEVTAGVTADRLYEQEASFALTLYPWSFAQKLVRLTKLDDEPIAGFSVIFQMPVGDNVLLLDRVTDQPDIPDRNFTDFKRFGDKIYSNADDLYAVVRSMASPHLWSPIFAKAVSTGLAGLLIEAIASDGKRADELKRQAYGNPSEQNRGGLIGTAMQTDSSTTPNKRMRMGRNPLTEAWSS